MTFGPFLRYVSNTSSERFLNSSIDHMVMSMVALYVAHSYRTNFLGYWLQKVTLCMLETLSRGAMQLDFKGRLQEVQILQQRFFTKSYGQLSLIYFLQLN